MLLLIPCMCLCVIFFVTISYINEIIIFISINEGRQSYTHRYMYNVLCCIFLIMENSSRAFATPDVIFSEMHVHSRKYFQNNGTVFREILAPVLF